MPSPGDLYAAPASEVDYELVKAFVLSAEGASLFSESLTLEVKEKLAAAGLSATKRCGSPVGRAILHVLEAHGHALTGDEHATTQSLLAAERTIDRADLADQPPWIHGFDRTQVASDAMWCYRNLGKPHEAIRFFEEASAVPGGHARSRCLTQLTLASIRTQQQEIDEACQVGHNALVLAEASHPCGSETPSSRCWMSSRRSAPSARYASSSVRPGGRSRDSADSALVAFVSVAANQPCQRGNGGDLGLVKVIPDDPLTQPSTAAAIRGLTCR